MRHLRIASCGCMHIIINPETTKCNFAEFYVTIAGMILGRIGVICNDLATKYLGIDIDK